MTVTPPQRLDPRIEEADWRAALESARRRLRGLMSGFSREEIEDAAQDVITRYVGFIRRGGLPERPEALLFALIRRVAAHFIRRRQRERAIEALGPTPWSSSNDRDDDEDEIQRQYASVLFQVREYFRLRRAQCVALAESKARGESLKDHAARAGTSYDKVRQDWVRCVKLIHDALRTKRLRLP